MKIKGFRALRPPAALAGEVACVPYDVVDSEEARALAAGHPRSFLHVARPEIDFAPGHDPHADDVYARAAENFARFQRQGLLVREDRESVYVYRQRMGQHVQRGVVACLHVDDYDRNLIRKHEKTRNDKEDDRTRHIGVLSANTGLVFLAYRERQRIDALVASIEAGDPLCRFTAADGVEHTVWRVSACGELEGAFEEVPACYIADGHHRAASAARVGRERRAANPGHAGHEEYNWFLGVLFPANQLRILPINRVVAALDGKQPDEFVRAVGRTFRVTPDAGPAPDGPRRISMYVAGKWYGLAWEEDSGGNPVAALDVSVLQDRLLSPLLGIADPRTDKRIDFVGGIRGAGELTARVDAGRSAAAFSMFPVTVDQVMAFADAGRIMPPKSTWFEPKLKSGLLIHTF